MNMRLDYGKTDNPAGTDRTVLSHVSIRRWFSPAEVCIQQVQIDFMSAALWESTMVFHPFSRVLFPRSRAHEHDVKKLNQKMSIGNKYQCIFYRYNNSQKIRRIHSTLFRLSLEGVRKLMCTVSLSAHNRKPASLLSRREKRPLCGQLRSSSMAGLLLTLPKQINFKINTFLQRVSGSQVLTTAVGSAIGINRPSHTARAVGGRGKHQYTIRLMWLDASGEVLW